MSAPFKSNLVLSQRVSSANFNAYCAGFDNNSYRFKALVDLLVKVIPEFALGFHEGSQISVSSVIDRLRDAVRTVYTTDKYDRRGEFGELILHMLLRDYHQTIPLVSKIYFKDSENAVPHGFDGVHITTSQYGNKLWLGESKLYGDGVSGVRDLAEDVVKHVNSDFLRKEFNLIRRKIPNDAPDINYWRDLMSRETTLEKIFSSIVVPMVCTYSSSLYSSHVEATEKFIEDFLVEVHQLKDKFYGFCPSTDIDIILMLLPIPDKGELVSALDSRLKLMQEI